MLCADDVISLDIDCPIDISAGEFACARISNIRLDITQIQAMLEPIIKPLVNPPYDNGIFDRVAKPLEKLDERLPGISDIRNVSTGVDHLLNCIVTCYS